VHRLTFTSPASATVEEATAIVAAIERFVRDTIAPSADSGEHASSYPWRDAGILEGVARDPRPAAADAWLQGSE
jgi:hypothetical protein